MNVRLKKIGVITALLALLGVSCGDMDLFDSDKMSDSINWQPNFTIPVGYGTVTMWKLLEQAGDDSVIVNVDNNLIIRYTQKDIYHLSATEVFDLPEQNIRKQVELAVKVPGVSNGTILLPEDLLLSMDDVLNLDLEEGYALEELVTSMNLNYSFSKMPFDYQVALVLENVKDGNTPLKIEESVNRTISRNHSYANLLFDMGATPNKIAYRLAVVIPKGQTITLTPDLKINLEFGLNRFYFDKIAGTMPLLTVDIPEDSFRMNVDFLNELSGSFRFADPRLDLTVANRGIGVPLELKMDFTAYGEGGKSVVFKGDPLKFSGNPLNTTTVTERKGYNKENSNIAELLSLPPTDRIEYGGVVNVNSDGGKVVLFRNAKANVDVNIEIPLSLTADSLVYRDTIKDISKIDDVEKIKAAALLLKVVNGIPLQVTLDKLVLTDRYNQPIDTVIIKKGTLEAAEDKGTSIVTKASSIEVVLSEKNIKSLGRLNNIILLIKASTANDGHPVTIKADASLELKIILNAKIDATL